MKNKLLLTTALAGVAFAFTANVKPAGAVEFIPASIQTINGGEYIGYTDGVFKTERKDNGWGGHYSQQLTLNNVTFERNTLNGNSGSDDRKKGGAAVYNDGILVVNGGTFEYNIATTTGSTSTQIGGGAIFNTKNGTLTVNGTTFRNNKAQGPNPSGRGGAIITLGTAEINNATFEGNDALRGGALSASDGTVNIFGGTFENNSATDGAGAIYNVWAKTTIEGTSFKKNRTQGGGGAIRLGSTTREGSVTLTDATFEDNIAIGDGGAIYVIKDTTSNGKGPGHNVLKVTGGSFKGNIATTGDGGAIFSGDESNLDIDGTLFEGNNAGKNGGAVSTAAKRTTIKNAIFKDNSAKTGGGALNIVDENDNFNTKRIVSLSGDVVFENNYAGGKKNDINFEKNHGRVSVSENSSLTLDGGISGNGTLSLSNETSVLNIKDTTTISSDVVGLGTLHLLVTDKTMDEGSLQLVGKDGVFTAKYLSARQGSLGLPVAPSYAEEMFDNNIDANNLYTFEKDEGSSLKNVTYTVKERSTGDIANRLGVKKAEAATLLATSSSESDSGNEAFDDIQDTLRSAAQYGNDSATLSRAADALVADAAPVVQTRETMLSNLIFDAANDALDDNASALVVGQASGDSVFEKAKVWIKGLFNSADKDDTSKAHGFDIDTYGVAMGADKEIGNGKVGLGYAYSQSDINGYTRDTDVDTHSLFVYGQYQPADWYVKGVASYSWSDYEEKKSVLGHDAKAKYDVDTLALEGLYGYNFHLGDDYDITPEGGLRYLHASQDSYTNGLGVRVKDRDIDVLTAVAGVKAAKNFELSNGMNIRPEVRAALTYDLSTDDNESSVLLPNGRAVKVEGEKLERFGYELGAKLATDITSNWEVSAGYEGRFREDYSDHTGILSAKYKF